MDKISKDERFSHLTKDPRFRRMPKNEQKVKIDKRFKDMFTDKRFKLKYSVDKRGKPIHSTTNENLKKYYELSDSEESGDEESDEDEEDNDNDNVPSNKKGPSMGEKQKKENKNVAKKMKEKQTSKDINEAKINKKTVVENKEKTKLKDVNKSAKNSKESTYGDRNSKSLDGKDSKQKAKLNFDSKVEDSDDSESQESDLDSGESEEGSNADSGLGDGQDLARGEGNIETSSDEDDDESEEEEDEDEIDHHWGELDKDVPEATEIGYRLAICNMDWDRIKAQDIFVLLNSFVPTGGSIKSVKIYPSEYGLQRMKEESLQGPVELVQSKVDNERNQASQSKDGEESLGSGFHREKLRQYQISRLKYYYAVVETDSVQTASKIYEECDGMEYESSSTKMDLRFIPDDMTFEEEPKSVCTEMPDREAYKPTLFVSSALAQSKVNLTWDETDQDRINVTMQNNTTKGKKKKEDINEDDYKAYLASSSDEEEEESTVVDKDVTESKDDNGSDEETEESQIQKYKSLLLSLDDQKEKKKRKDLEMEVSWEPGLKETTEKIVTRKEKTKGQSPWDAYLMKKKEKRQKKKEEKKLKKTESSVCPPDENASTLSQGQEENPAFSDDDIPGDVDMNDPFFRDERDSQNKLKDKSKKKKKNKKKQSQEDKSKEDELELLMMDEEEDPRKHFNLKSLMEETKKKKKKSKLKQTEGDKGDFQMNVDDTRFSAIFDSHLYNIDPSAPEFKKTKFMDAMIQEKFKRRTSDKQSNSHGNKRKLDAAENEIKTKIDKVDYSECGSVSSLVKSIKSKTQSYHNKKKR